MSSAHGLVVAKGDQKMQTAMLMILGELLINIKECQTGKTNAAATFDLSPIFFANHHKSRCDITIVTPRQHL
jgi:hypothetical protein